MLDVEIYEHTVSHAGTIVFEREIENTKVKYEAEHRRQMPRHHEQYMAMKVSYLGKKNTQILANTVSTIETLQGNFDI